MFKTTRGLILREVRYKEADRILTVLTEDMGKMTVKARGALRKNSKTAASTQLLAFSELTLLERIPGSYLRCAPLPIEWLARWNLVQKFCRENQAVYYDALLTNASYKMTEIEEGCVAAIVELYKEAQ